MKRIIKTIGFPMLSVVPLVTLVSCGSNDESDPKKNLAYNSIAYNKQTDGKLLIDIKIDENTLGYSTDNSYWLLSDVSIMQVSNAIENHINENSIVFNGILLKVNNFSIKSSSLSNVSISLDAIKTMLNQHFS